MKLKNVRQVLVVLIVIVAAAFTLSCRKSNAPLQGTWNLATVAGKDPATADVKSWQIKFDQGTWTFSGDMTGKYQGMKVNGAGTWSLQGDQLEFTAGTAIKGTTKIHVTKDELTFDADPVIKPEGTQLVETKYRRVE